MSYLPAPGEVLNPERGLTLNQTRRFASGGGALADNRLTEIRDVLELAADHPNLRPGGISPAARIAGKRAGSDAF